MGFNSITGVNQQGFRAVAQNTVWDVLSPAAGGTAIGQKTIVSGRSNWFEANQGPVIVNDNNLGTHGVARMQLNGGNIDVNFANGEPCVVGRYPSGTTSPDNTPVTLTFTNPVSGVGAYVLFVSNSQTLYDGRSITGHMLVMLAGKNTWEPVICQSTAITGHKVNIGNSPTAPFVAAESNGGDLIKAVCFEIAFAGAVDFLAISRLYWKP